MIELPEATTIAAQMRQELAGKVIKAGDRGNWPHKFAFFTYEAEEYARVLAGKTVGEARPLGSSILVPIEPGYGLSLGVGGERILYHRSAATLPAKRQLCLEFIDGTYLTVSIQGWGSVLLGTPKELERFYWACDERPSSVDPRFTPEHFLSLFRGLTENDSTPVKAFMISKPGVPGVGNGVLADILWRAKIHPRRRAIGLADAERTALYRAAVEIPRQMIECGGRDSEVDLYGMPGGYRRVVDSKTVGTPCPACGTAIQRFSYLGGKCYVCPRCQVEPKN